MTGLIVLLRNNVRLLRNMRRVLREQSRLKVGFILLFGFGIMAGVWALFAEGFIFLSALGGVGLMLINRLFALFFFGLGLMLVLSNIITSYAMLYRSEETTFLLLRPITRGEVAVHKFAESALVSSWAFFFMIIPFVGAYAWHERLPIYFSLWTLLFSVPFVLLCSAIGTLATIAALRVAPRGRWVAPALAAAALFILILGLRYMGGRGAQDETTFVLSRLVPGLKISGMPMLPSWWVAEGILSFSREQWARGSLFLGLLLVNLLGLVLLIEMAGDAWFYHGWQRSASRASATRRRPVLFRTLDRLLGILPADLRALMLKDLRSLFRDPVQWTQGLLFFGLLGLYFLNLRHLRYHMLSPVWRNLIVFLNVFSLSAVMCSFCSRFVYPQLSLEGHGFWIVGLAPTTMGRVLLAKFLGAVAGLLGLSAGLMLLSTGMLGVDPAVRFAALAVAAAMSLALPGLATGLGAVFLDLKQRNPMAIISGFGGTLNLVLSLVVMALAVFPFGWLYHLKAMGQIGPSAFAGRQALVFAWLAFLTLTSTLLPLHLGRRSLMAREY
jgi:ABC-2 type transport system permease protein